MSKSAKSHDSYTLALKVHHDFCSCKLSDILHCLGWCISHDELRRFLASSGSIVQSFRETVYRPAGLQPVDETEEKTFANAAIYNFDQNEENLDGKSTTYAMAIVMHNHESKVANTHSIPRSTWDNGGRYRCTIFTHRDIIIIENQRYARNLSLLKTEIFYSCQATGTKM